MLKLYLLLIALFTAFSLFVSPDSFFGEPYAEVIRDFYHNAKTHGIKSILVLDYGYIAIPQRFLAWIIYLIAPNPLMFSTISIVASHICLAALGMILLLPPFQLLIPSVILRLLLGLALPLSIDYESRVLFNWPHVSFLPLLASALLLCEIKRPIAYGAIWVLIPFCVAKPFSIILLPLFCLAFKHRPAKLLVLLTLLQIVVLFINRDSGPPNLFPLPAILECLEAGIYALPFVLSWAGIFFFPLIFFLSRKQIILLGLLFLIHLIFLAASFKTTLHAPLGMYRHMIPVWSMLHLIFALGITKIQSRYLSLGRFFCLLWIFIILKHTHMGHWRLHNHGFPMSGASWFFQASLLGISPENCIPINPWTWLSHRQCYTKPDLMTFIPEGAFQHTSSLIPFHLILKNQCPDIQGMYLFAKSSDPDMQKISYRVEIESNTLTRHLILHTNSVKILQNDMHLLWVPLNASDQEIRIWPGDSLKIYQTPVSIFKAL
ncbi:MAG: hypothetical protein H3C47_09410 [Candidatus Cloacimonetes bacterium]|nr:hypothetical protein [Candidatus Cloacimonadota bacterium]